MLQGVARSLRHGRSGPDLLPQFQALWPFVLAHNCRCNMAWHELAPRAIIARPRGWTD